MLVVELRAAAVRMAEDHQDWYPFTVSSDSEEIHIEAAEWDRPKLTWSGELSKAFVESIADGVYRTLRDIFSAVSYSVRRIELPASGQETSLAMLGLYHGLLEAIHIQQLGTPLMAELDAVLRSWQAAVVRRSLFGRKTRRAPVRAQWRGTNIEIALDAGTVRFPIGSGYSLATIFGCFKQPPRTFIVQRFKAMHDQLGDRFCLGVPFKAYDSSLIQMELRRESRTANFGEIFLSQEGPHVPKIGRPMISGSVRHGDRKRLIETMREAIGAVYEARGAEIARAAAGVYPGDVFHDFSVACLHADAKRDTKAVIETAQRWLGEGERQAHRGEMAMAAATLVSTTYDEDEATGYGLFKNYEKLFETHLGDKRRHATMLLNAAMHCDKSLADRSQALEYARKAAVVAEGGKLSGLETAAKRLVGILKG